MHKMLTSDQVRQRLQANGIEPSNLEISQLKCLVVEVEPLITQMHPAVIQEFLCNIQAPLHDTQRVA